VLLSGVLTRNGGESKIEEGRGLKEGVGGGNDP